MKEKWRPLTRELCTVVLGCVDERWVDRRVVSFVEMENALRQMRTAVERFALGRAGVYDMELKEPTNILDNLRGQEQWPTVVCGVVRRIIAQAIGCDPAEVQDVCSDHTVYYSGSWLVCVTQRAVEPNAYSMDLTTFRVDLTGPVDLGAFIRGVEAVKQWRWMGDLVLRAAEFRLIALTEAPGCTAVSPMVAPGAIGAFAWFVLGLPAGGRVVELAIDIVVYQARVGAAYVGFLLHLGNSTSGEIQARCARFPSSLDPETTRVCYEIVARVTDPGGPAFNLMHRLSRWRSGHNPPATRFDVQNTHRLQDADLFESLTLAVARLLYPGEYTTRVEGRDRCVARSDQYEFQVIAHAGAVELRVARRA
jgi:hypothetical protein